MRVLSTVDAYLALADLGARADEHAWLAPADLLRLDYQTVRRLAAEHLGSY
jgi:hypothetical protein